MKPQKYYSTDQVIEMFTAIKGPSSYANEIANAVICELERQRPKKLTFLQKIGLKP